MGPDPFLRNEGNDMVDFLSECLRNIAGPQAALETKKPLTKSKIRILKVVKGIIESKKTKDIDKDRVTQSSRANLVKAVDKRL